MQGAAGLFGSAILEVAIGLLFLYFVLSMICSGIVEMLASWLKWRSRNLEFALGNLLTDKDLLRRVVNDPLIRAMGQSASESRGQEREAMRLEGSPSYIGSSTFALAVLNALARPGADARAWTLDLGQVRQNAITLAQTSGDDAKRITGEALVTLIEQTRDPIEAATELDRLKSMLQQGLAQSAPDNPQLIQQKLQSTVNLDQVKAVIAGMSDGPARAWAEQALANASTKLDAAGLKLDRVRTSIEAWFDRAMDRASGKYKRKTLRYVAAIAILLTVFTGADSIGFVTRLYTDSALRAQLAAQASTVQGNQPPDISRAVQQLEPFATLFGYLDYPGVASSTFAGWAALKLTGELITVFAILQGAPFWFQLLTRLVNLRSSGPPPESPQPSS
jgi:hypothetical protein